jgi:CRISPR system Cascade subunit CasC
MQLEIHLLQSFPPANLNRDENGMPKSTVFGGRPRARISSQCQKRSVRQYYHHFHEELGIDPKHFADRSRSFAPALCKILIEKGIPQGQAELVARLAISVLTEKSKKDKDKKAKKGKARSEESTDETAVEEPVDDKAKSDTILFLGRTEVEAIATALISSWSEVELGVFSDTPALPKDVINKGIIPSVKPPKDSNSAYGKPGDVALFGRMMAVLPEGNVDAAVQMAHAIGINTLQQEFDFFTAVDNLKESGDDTGADHMGETGYNSSTYYRFATLDTVQLQNNLGKDVQANAIAEAFAEAFIKAIPTGHQNGFAAHSLPAAVMVVVRNGQPVSLVDAFENPAAPKGSLSLLDIAVSKLDSHWADLGKMYGEKSILYKGIVTRTQLAQQLKHLAKLEKASVEELLKEAIAAAFPGGQ